MKVLILALLTLATFQASATVDGHTKAYIVVQKIQEPDVFFVERVPVIGCFGVGYGPQLVQFTAPYKASSNIGCGDEQLFDEINFLTCAKVTDTETDSTGSELQGLTLDISLPPLQILTVMVPVTLASSMMASVTRPTARMEA